LRNLTTNIHISRNEKREPISTDESGVLTDL